MPFAKYLNEMHNRMHPIFADELIAALEKAPPDDPRNRKGNVTRLEIVLAGSGELERVTVIRSSGVPAFDEGALDAVRRGAPFGVAPHDILSFDGRVYVHWEFHRDEVLACSTMNARPYLLTE